MPLEARTIRFAADAWEMIDTEAAAAGLSTAEFIRGSAIFRCGFSLARRDPTHASGLDEMYAMADRLGRGYYAETDVEWDGKNRRAG